MKWFNVYGAVLVAVILVPNVLFALKCRDGFENRWQNKAVECIEQIGRFGCFGFMIFNIPGTCFGWWSDAHRVPGRGCGAGGGLLRHLGGLLSQEQRVSRAGAVDHPVGAVFVQRDHEPVGAADRGGGAVRAEPYPPLLSERKVKNPTGLR